MVNKTAATTATCSKKDENANRQDSLYIWDGILETFDDNDDSDDNSDQDASGDVIRVTWKGRWIVIPNAADAMSVEAPKRHAFSGFLNSDKSFQLRGEARTAVVGKDADAESYYEIHFETPGAGKSLGKHSDRGVGKDGKDFLKDEDTKHVIHVASLRWTGNIRNQVQNLVFGRGNNSTHGDFVSVGWLRVGNRITLARRYYRNNDVINNATSDVSNHDQTQFLKLWRCMVLNQILSFEKYDDCSLRGRETSVRIPPWQCLAMHSSCVNDHCIRLDDSNDNVDYDQMQIHKRQKL